MRKSTKLSTAIEAFVDTSGFFALLVKQDPMHARAAAILARAAQKRSRFVTSDYVLDETATLLKARGLDTWRPDFFKPRSPLDPAGSSGWIPTGSSTRFSFFSSI